MGPAPSKSGVDIAGDPLPAHHKKGGGQHNDSSPTQADNTQNSLKAKDTKASGDKTAVANLLKDLDVSKLKHALTDPIENFYQLSDKILGMYAEAHISH